VILKCRKALWPSGSTKYLQLGRSFFGDAAEANQALSGGSAIVVMSVYEASDVVTVDYREESLAKSE
jgi:hypothetical protein